MTESEHPVLALHMLARDQLMSDVERLAPDRGLKDAVAVMRGWTQEVRAASLLMAWRRVLQSLEMPEGMRVILACGLSWVLALEMSLSAFIISSSIFSASFLRFAH